jgi:hypothetical protein
MWIVIALGAGAVFVACALWFRRLGASLKWWEWTLGATGIALGLFAMQNYYASVAEFEPKAPGMFLLVFGLPSLILFLLGLILPALRYLMSVRRPKKPEANPAAQSV